MKFNNGKELLDLCSKENLMISDIMIKLEMNNYNKTEDEVFAQMHKSFIIMKNAVHKSLTEDIKSMGGLIGGEAKKLIKQIENNKNISGLTTSKAMAYAMGVLEVNASMGLIVAAPTAGSCGVAKERMESKDEDVTCYDWFFCTKKLSKEEVESRLGK